MHALVCRFTMGDLMSGQLALERKLFTTSVALEFESFMCVKMFGQ